MTAWDDLLSGTYPDDQWQAANHRLIRDGVEMTEAYDDRSDAEHGYASPFDHSHEPEEPPRGTVMAYQRRGHSGAVLDYVSMRAGDGLWYTTGARAEQAVTWPRLWAAVRARTAGPVRYATAWAVLADPSLPARVHGYQAEEQIR